MRWEGENAAGFTLTLLSPAFSRNFVYEVAVGINGAVWFRCPSSPLETIIVRNAILNSQFLDDAHCEAMVEKLVELARTRR